MNKIVIVGNGPSLVSKIKDIIDLDIQIINIEELEKDDNQLNLNTCDLENYSDFYAEKNNEFTKISKKNIKSESHSVKQKTKNYKRRGLIR